MNNIKHINRKKGVVLKKDNLLSELQEYLDDLICLMFVFQSTEKEYFLCYHDLLI